MSERVVIGSEQARRTTFEALVRKAWTSGYECKRDSEGNYIEGAVRFAWWLSEEVFAAHAASDRGGE